MIVGKRQTEKPIRWAMVGGGGDEPDRLHPSLSRLA